MTSSRFLFSLVVNVLFTTHLHASRIQTRSSHSPVLFGHRGSHAAERSLAAETTESLQQSQPDEPSQLRVVACLHLKNELPYLVEWLEFHHLVGFSHFVIYDDFSTDNVQLLETLYREHDRRYITIHPPSNHGLDNNARRSKNAGHCFQHYGNDSDWMINIDVDEFVWSPTHRTIQEYLTAEVDHSTHMVYVGATRFGWSGQRHRFTYAIQQANASANHSVQLTNPNGVQLLTSSHDRRAPDHRFGEPEQFIRDSNPRCQEWQASQGEMSPCTNDYNGRYGKAFVRTRYAVSVWTHGGGVRGHFGEASMFDGRDVGTERCPAPLCAKADPSQLHIYHLRAPSIADTVKKDLDEAISNPEEAEKRMQVSDESYEAETWFFNQIRDDSLARYKERLTERIRPLLAPHNHSHAA